MRRQDPYEDIALPVQTGDPYADIALPIPTNRNRRQDAPVPQDGADVPFQPELAPGDNAVYPTMRPGFEAIGTPQAPLDTIGEEEAAANRNVFGAQGTRLDPIDLNTLPPEDRAYLNAGMWVKLGNGEVRRMMADARPTAGGPGTQEIRPGLFVEETAGVGTDMAKSFPTGVVEGLTGLAGMQGTLGQMIGGRPGEFLPGFGIVGPSGEQMNEGIRAQIGYDYYQPQTVAGEYSRTLGEFLPGFAAPGGVGMRAASVAVPAVTSESAGQLARALSGGERDTAAEGFARMGGGLIGGAGVGITGAMRSGADNVLRNAAENVSPQQLDLAAALRARSPVPLTNAEALQQVTGGATGMGRVQRVVEGANSRLAPMMAQRPERVEQAISGALEQIGPAVEPSALAPQVREAAGGVLNTLRRRANEDARPFYDRLPGQSLPPEQFQQLTENPSFAAALRSVRGDEELAPLLSRELPMEQDVRMLRAQQQGFNTDRPYYHGSRQPFEGEFRTDMTERGALGEGLYVTRRPQIASEYAGSEGAVYPTFLRQGSVLDTTTPEGGAAFRAGAEADIIRAPGQSVVRNPDAVRSTFDPFAAPRPDNDLNVINEVVKQLGTMADEAAPNSMRVGGSMTRAAQRTEAQRLADALAREASPDYAMARDTVRGVNEAFIDPLKAGPIGALADTAEAAPNLGAMTGRLFPSQPFEGQAAETARALQLMNEIDPNVGGPLVRQHLARMAAEANQANVGGANQFGGAKFAAQAFGNPLQRETTLGAVDTVAPMASRDIRDLVEALLATGQREAQGSNTSFNSQFLDDLRNGNAATNVVQGITNLPGLPGRLARGIDDWTARRNAETLAEMLMADSDVFSARLTRAINRPRGANRIRAGVAVGAGQED